MDYQHLSTLLWREQELLDLLLFKAEEKQYLILTGKTRWLPRIAHEIEVVLDQLRTLEVERAAATEVLADPSSAGASYIDVTDPARPAAGAGQQAVVAAGLATTGSATSTPGASASTSQTPQPTTQTSPTGG